jgi:wobble nucleotide-excising tRNase
VIRKFIFIKNVGRYKNSASTPNPQLARNVFVLGANGHGKTTLCDVMRSLQTGNAAYVTGRKTLGATEAPTVELLMEGGGVTRFDGTAWNTPLPTTAIYDGTFVAHNVHAGDVVDADQRRNLYRVIVGQEGVALAEEETRLAAVTRTKTGEITTVTRVLQQHLPAGMTVQQFIALAADDEIDAKIAEQERSLAALREGERVARRDSLTEVALPAAPDLDALLARSIDGLAADAEAQIAAHLRAHPVPSGEQWLADGTAHAVDACPYCAQDLRGVPLVGVFRAVFGSAYRTLKADVSALDKTVQDAFGPAAIAVIERQLEANRGAVTFWQQYCAFDPAAVDAPPGIAEAMRSVHAAATSLLATKGRSPLDPLVPSQALIDALAAYRGVTASVDATNTSIRLVNVMILQKKAETAGGDIATAESRLARSTATKRRHEPAIAADCAEFVRLNAEKDEAEAAKTGVRARLEQHTRDVVRPYENRINALLDSFNARFQIAETRHTYAGGVATSSYQLVINETPVNIGDRATPIHQPSFKNTLSAGDRSTLALAFFLAHLERDPRRAQMVVVFDDPFQSQDSFRRRQTVHEIKKCGAECAQVIVLSHDATFLKQIWDKAPTADRVALQISDARAQGSKLHEVNLDAATQGRVASEIDHLQAFLSTGAGQHLVDVIKKMRVVLETYCKTTYQTSFQAGDWLGDIVRKIREGGDTHPAASLYDELDQINDYTAEYHHGQDADTVADDQIDATELTGFVRRTLKVVNALQA